MSHLAALIRTASLSIPLLVGASSTVSAAPLEAVSAPTKGNKGKRGKRGKRGKKGVESPTGRLCGRLKCTAAQAEQISSRLQKLRQQHRDARKGHAALQTALSRELAKDAPSKKELARIQRDIERMQSKISDALLDALLDIHAVLGAEQRKTLAAMIERNGLRRMMRGHDHPGR